MIEISMNNKISQKYFGIYYGDNVWQLVPKNKEIIPFLKYFKDFYYINSDLSHKESGHCKLILENKNFDNIEKELISSNAIYNEEILIFEFETEEEAFYFRLKLL